jgi:hypothetical protein
MKRFIGKTLTGKLISVHAGDNEDLSKDTRESLSVEIGGIAGDKHQGPARKVWEGEWEPAGARVTHIPAKPDTRTASPTACVNSPKPDLAFRVPAVIDV